MKNKILLAAAVAVACGAPVAAMADANIYGQLRYSINSMDPDTAGSDSSLSGEDNVSVFGLKASAEGNGITAFAHLQTGAPADNNSGQAFKQRFYFGGLKGDFGTVAYGRMTNAYKMPGFKLDPFYNMSHVNASGSLATGGATYGLSPATNGFTDNALQYTSPSMSGLKVNVGLYIDDSAEDDHGTNIGVTYTAGNINVGVQFASNDTTAGTVPGVNADGDAMRIHGGYTADKWSAGFSYENVDNGTAIGTLTEDADYMYVVGKFNASKDTQIVASFGSVSDDTATVVAGAPPTITVSSQEGSGMNLGVFQTVAPKTQVYASYSTASLDTVDVDPSVFSVGAIHKF